MAMRANPGAYRRSAQGAEDRGGVAERRPRRRVVETARKTGAAHRIAVLATRLEAVGPTRQHQISKKSEPQDMAGSEIEQAMTEIIQRQPDDASYDDILRALALERMVDRGLEDVRNGRTRSNEEVAELLAARRR